MSDNLTEWKLSVVKQQFSLPEAFVFYIAKDPTSVELFHKLIRCCKHFWLKNPIITLCEMFPFPFRRHNSMIWQSVAINGFQRRSIFQMENMVEKLWVTQRLSIFDDQNKFLTSSLIPRIYRCELNCLVMKDQTISFGDFKVFTSSGSLKWLRLDRVLVKNDDGSVVPIEKLIELLPKLRSFEYTNVKTEEGFQTITSETAENLIAIPHFPKMKHFDINSIPETFDFETFFATPKVRTSMFIELAD